MTQTRRTIHDVTMDDSAGTRPCEIPAVGRTPVHGDFQWSPRPGVYGVVA